MSYVTRSASAAMLTAAVLLSATHMSAQADNPSQSTASSALAKEGRLLYRDMCARCHGDALQGQVHAPPLKGEAFRATWSGKTARALYGRILSTMPLESPGSLLVQDVVRITLYGLSASGAVLPPTPIEGPAGLNDIEIEFMDRPEEQ